MAAQLGEGWGATVKSAVEGALAIPSDRVALEYLEIAANYTHNLVKMQSTEASIGIAIAPATLNVARRGTREETSTGNLSITARYVGRDLPQSDGQ